jgi:2-amino-4-hydroxy-6-hydroxymethyldihydropteridine diphosphokinase
MNTVYLLLGSNLEDRAKMIRRASGELAEKIGLIRQSSSVYESEPWGFEAKNSFLNQVVKLETGLDPVELLDKILEIEHALGRRRESNHMTYASRIIDIDILFYNDEIIQGERLNIPHPNISQRMFTLVPLCELNGSLIHPVFNKSLADLKSECPDRNQVVIFNS